MMVPGVSPGAANSGAFAATSAKNQSDGFVDITGELDHFRKMTKMTGRISAISNNSTGML
jgi:hypothetical protein